MNQADKTNINNEQRAEDNNNNDVTRNASMEEAPADEDREIESPSDLNLHSNTKQKFHLWDCATMESPVQESTLPLFSQLR